MEVHHDCAESVHGPGWGLHASCVGDVSLTTALVVGVSVAVILGAVGVGVWWVVRRMRGY